MLLRHFRHLTPAAATNRPIDHLVPSQTRSRSAASRFSPTQVNAQYALGHGGKPHRRGLRVAAAAAADDTEARMDALRGQQMRITDLLAKLVDSNDPVGVARQHVEALTEEFFQTGATYMTLAHQEGNTDIAARLERALTAAWNEKQATLRPELQLLNTLVRAERDEDRKQIYMSGGADVGATLLMNDRWFFATLDRFTRDVEAQPNNPAKVGLVARLRAIKAETEAIARQASKQQQK